ncbi:transcriptional repressor [Noviherbaspirillum sp. CPCC 100848]|uniref:Ferric uptake regulation protein n=1 Tax=Noviherbaspirillum album TaxID=3080276 RepID=A0ABU6J3F8_9BURK|nr:transcriptional repressor [Noviherbaspirillum sp. CPCC 100848]MEC4718144.1 transcriptional repressor [Noviherbaspirillum sp. CPCC 100848]
MQPTPSRTMDIPKEIRDCGLRATLPRVRVLQLFHENPGKHFSADDNYHLLSNENIDVVLATVYRVLLQFAEANILIRHTFDTDRAFFELNKGSHHDHIICTKCGCVEDFVDDAIEQRQALIAKQHRYILQTHTLTLYGLCETCTQPGHWDRVVIFRCSVQRNGLSKCMHIR